MPQSVVPVGLVLCLCPRKQFYTKLFVYNTVVLGKQLAQEVERQAIVVYLFPLSAEISQKDRRIQFEAQIGRIVFSQDFDLSEMEFLGKLEL